jgi:hypothetical protein
MNCHTPLAPAPDTALTKPLYNCQILKSSEFRSFLRIGSITGKPVRSFIAKMVDAQIYVHDQFPVQRSLTSKFSAALLLRKISSDRKIT